MVRRVGIFTYGMGSSLTGIGRYAVELSRGLRRVAPNIEIILLNPYPESKLPWYREFETYAVPELRLVPLAATLGNLSLHRAALRLELDILHDPCGIAPFLAPRRAYARVVTVHDAIPFVTPEVQPLATRLVFRTLIRAARNTADAIITVSHSAAEDLAHHAGLPGEKLHVIPLAAADPPPPDPGHCRATLARLGLTTPYFLYVGALSPRKNLARVLAAFRAVAAARPEASLALVGPPVWRASELLGSVRRSDRVVVTGFVSDADLNDPYTAAAALVFPSLYEGFGLPALEAMARGTPVIASNSSSLPEVVEQAGILVNPRAVTAIADAMRRILDDPKLAQELARRGVAQASNFSWDRTARETIAVYERALEARRHPGPAPGPGPRRGS